MEISQEITGLNRLQLLTSPCHAGPRAAAESSGSSPSGSRIPSASQALKRKWANRLSVRKRSECDAAFPLHKGTALVASLPISSNGSDDTSIFQSECGARTLASDYGTAQRKSDSKGFLPDQERICLLAVSGEHLSLLIAGTALPGLRYSRQWEIHATF